MTNIEKSARKISHHIEVLKLADDILERIQWLQDEINPDGKETKYINAVTELIIAAESLRKAATENIFSTKIL